MSSGAGRTAAADANGERATEFPLGAQVTLAELEGDPHQLLARLREREPVSFCQSSAGG